MKKLLFSALFLAAMTVASAQERNYGQSATIRIWDNASAPHSNELSGTEQERTKDRLWDVTSAELYLFPADTTKATGQAVLICPGGGYAFLSMNQEGYQLAQWFAANGITAAVLKYRMPNGHKEVPFEDAEQAIRILAGLEAGATGFTIDQVGIVGCSAGGHLAATVSTMAKTKPAFAILFYPVITGEAGKCHQGSFDKLLGPERTAEQTAYYSLENRVTAETPPTLLLLSDDDKTVPSISSTRYYNSLKANGVKASMHIYPSGGHGWGVRDSFKYKDQWQAAALDFLAGVKQ